MVPVSPPERIQSLQLLRGIAALSVAVAHFHHEYLEIAGGVTLGFGGFGVDLFFVISGFIMAHTCWSAFGQPRAGAVFLLRRLSRIVPLYWIATGLTVLLVLYTQPLSQADLSPASIWGSFLFFPVQRPSGSFNPPLTVGWTLNYEMFFYALFGLLLAFRRAIGLVLAVAFLAGAAIWPINSQLEAVSFWFAPIVIEFAFGILVACAFKAGLRVNRQTASIMAVFGLAAMVLFYWRAAYGLPVRLPQERGFSVGVGAGLIVAAAVLTTWTGKGRLWDFGVRLGDASYALYILHPLFFWIPVILGMHGVAFPTKNVFYMSIVLSAAIYLSLLAYRYLERPLTRWLVHRATSALQPSEPRTQLTSLTAKRSEGIVRGDPGHREIVGLGIVFAIYCVYVGVS